jgi:hypothetical protein
MAKKTINLGSGDSRGDGESIRTAFDKCNDNFSELYADISTLDGSKIVYGDLSVATASASGAGSLAYNSSTGVFTFTPAALGFDGDYNSLTNTPTIPTVPTTVSSFTNDSGYITGYTVTESDVTAHQAALTITESQISDLTHFSGSYNDLTDKPDLTDYATIAQGVQGAAAFSWGDHSTAGYLRSVSEAAVTAHQAALTITESQISDLTHFSGSYTDLTNKPTIPGTGNFSLSNNTISTNNGDDGIDLAISGATSDPLPAFVNKAWRFVNDGSLQFRDPLDFGSEVKATITTTKVGNWDTAYGWGNHASAGYLTDAYSAGSGLSLTGTEFAVDATVVTTSATQTLSNKSGNISQWTNDSGYVESDTTGITGADQVSNIVTLTQVEYDAIGTPNASTVYIIVG